VIRRVGNAYQFLHAGEWRTLKDPSGPASPAQLARLNLEGRLLVVWSAKPITKLAAAQEIDQKAAS
jgi:hypothetical protein